MICHGPQSLSSNSIINVTNRFRKLYNTAHLCSYRLRALMEAAVEVNMNSIRIWGGGIYETDDFYDIADELGILVWQDMMFACSMYPVDEDFLRSVRTEIRYQVQLMTVFITFSLYSLSLSLSLSLSVSNDRFIRPRYTFLLAFCSHLLNDHCVDQPVDSTTKAMPVP